MSKRDPPSFRFLSEKMDGKLLPVVCQRGVFFNIHICQMKMSGLQGPFQMEHMLFAPNSNSTANKLHSYYVWEVFFSGAKMLPLRPLRRQCWTARINRATSRFSDMTFFMIEPNRTHLFFNTCLYLNRLASSNRLEIKTTHWAGLYFHFKEDHLASLSLVSLYCL